MRAEYEAKLADLSAGGAAAATVAAGTATVAAGTTIAPTQQQIDDSKKILD